MNIHPIEGQIAAILEHFPNLNPDSAIEHYRELSEKNSTWGEGIVVLVSADALAKHYGYNTTDTNERYRRVVTVALEKLAESRESSFSNVLAQVNAGYLRRHESCAPIYEHLYQTQRGSDLILVQGQFGERYAGYSAIRALELMSMDEREIPSGVFEGAITALANPGLYARANRLGTFFPADEFCQHRHWGFVNALYLRGGKGPLTLRSHYAKNPLYYCGAMSFQQLPKVRIL